MPNFNSRAESTRYQFRSKLPPPYPVFVQRLPRGLRIASQRRPRTIGVGRKEEKRAVRAGKAGSTVKERDVWRDAIISVAPKVRLSAKAIAGRLRLNPAWKAEKAEGPAAANGVGAGLKVNARLDRHQRGLGVRVEGGRLPAQVHDFGHLVEQARAPCGRRH